MGHVPFNYKYLLHNFTANLYIDDIFKMLATRLQHTFIQKATPTHTYI